MKTTEDFVIEEDANNNANDIEDDDNGEESLAGDSDSTTESDNFEVEKSHGTSKDSEVATVKSQDLAFQVHYQEVLHLITTLSL